MKAQSPGPWRCLTHALPAAPQFCSMSGTGKLVRVDWKMDGAKYRPILEENLLKAAKDLRLGRRKFASVILHHWGAMASYTPEASSSKSLQIVLIGSTGSGKSSSGNTILNQKHFFSTTSGKSVTLKCQSATEIINDWNITIVDTPGWDCTEISQHEVVREIKRALQNIQGPYSVLLVLKVGGVEAQDIDQIYKIYGHALSPSYLEHTTILFSHSDNLEWKTFKEYLSEGGKEFQELLRNCGQRCHFWNNREGRCNEDVEKVLKDLKSTEMKDLHSMKNSQYSLSKNKVESIPEENVNGGKRIREGETVAMDTKKHQKAVRVLFLGMSKVGKTSSIKTLQRRGVQTENKDVYYYSAAGMNLQLIDSQGFDENPEEIQKVILKSVSTCVPHAVMIVMNVGRFTPATKKTMQRVQDYLRQTAVKNTIILFTGKDNLDGKPIDRFIQENADLHEFVSRNGNRFHALNNRDPSDQRQVDDLLQKIFTHKTEDTHSSSVHEKEKGFSLTNLAFWRNSNHN